MEDAQLVTQARGGDEDAFAELLRRHEGRIYGLCVRMLGSPEEAREVTQEVFVAAWQGLSKFRSQSAVFTWLYRIAINLSLRRRRGLGRFRRALMRMAGLERGGRGDEAPEGLTEPSGPLSASNPLPPDPSQASARPNPEQAMESTEQREVIERALGELAPELRAAILLRDRDGRSYEELAESLGWKMGTVKSRLNRARGTLAEAVGRIAPDLIPHRGGRRR